MSEGTSGSQIHAVTPASRDSNRDPYEPPSVDTPLRPERMRSGVPLALIWTLVRTDFKVRYHGALSGFVWALLKPLSMFVVLMAVFSFLFRDPSYKLNLIIGLFLWDVFSEGTKSGLMSLSSKGYLLTKSRCPAWILVVTSLSNSVITLVVFGLIITVFLTVAGHVPSTAGLAHFLAYSVALVIISTGISLGTSVLFLRYRDLNQVWDVVTQAGFFIAPIIYPIGTIPERFHFYLYLWPPTPVIEFSRTVLIRGNIPSRTAHIDLTIGTAIILLVGVVIFRRFGPRAAEYV